MSIAVQTPARPSRPRKTHADQIVQAMQRSGMLPFHVTLSLPQAMALSRFMGDLHAAWGSSGTLAPIVLDRIFSPSGQRAGIPPCATSNMERCQKAIDALRDHERDLVRWLVLARERGNITLASLGREKSGVDEVHTARGVAAGYLQALGQTLAEIYGARNSWPQ